MPDQSQKTRPVAPAGPGGGGEGPSAPKVDKPNVDELLKRMRKVDPDQARRYRQRTGQSAILLRLRATFFPCSPVIMLRRCAPPSHLTRLFRRKPLPFLRFILLMGC